MDHCALFSFIEFESGVKIKEVQLYGTNHGPSMKKQDDLLAFSWMGRDLSTLVNTGDMRKKFTLYSCILVTLGTGLFYSEKLKTNH